MKKFTITLSDETIKEVDALSYRVDKQGRLRFYNGEMYPAHTIFNSEVWQHIEEHSD